MSFVELSRKPFTKSAAMTRITGAAAAFAAAIQLASPSVFFDKAVGADIGVFRRKHDLSQRGLGCVPDAHD